MLDTWPPQPKKELNLNQMEIKFFWPLTEQIPLDLDYTNCQRKLTTQNDTIPIINDGTGITLATQPTWVTATFSGPVETPELVMKLDKQPNIIVKWLYKLLNIKWKV